MIKPKLNPPQLNLIPVSEQALEWSDAPYDLMLSESVTIKMLNMILDDVKKIKELNLDSLCVVELDYCIYTAGDRCGWPTQMERLILFPQRLNDADGDVLVHQRVESKTDSSDWVLSAGFSILKLIDFLRS